MGDVHSGGVVVAWGEEGTWDSLYFPLHFAVNLKSLKKKKTQQNLLIKKKHWGSIQKEPRGTLGATRVNGAEGWLVWASR